MTAMTGYSSNQPGPLAGAAPAAAPVSEAAKITAVLFAILAGSLVLAPPARAGDPPGPCLPTACTGLYVGVNLTGTMTNANVIGNGVNGSLAGGGQSIGGQLGYQFANGTWFFGPELFGVYTVNGNPNLTGGSPPKYLFGEVLKVGTSLSTLFNVPSNANPAPGIPAALANAVISPYLVFGAAQRPWGDGWLTGAGVTFALAQNWFADVRYSYINYGNATVSPTQTTRSENLVTVGLNYKF